MSVAQSISKQTNIVKQSGIGSPGSSGSVTRRRTSSVFKSDIDTYKSAEIVTHQQSTGVGFGIRKPNGKLNGQLSPGTYAGEFSSIVRAAFATGVNSTALTNVTAAAITGAQGTFTRAAGSFLTDGFKLFDVVRWTGWATTGVPNNSVNMMIIALTATVMTVTRFDTTAIGAKASGDTVTATVVGKKTKAPLTGHTNDYYTVEEAYTDLGRYELFTDAQVGKADISIPATGFSTVAFDWFALARTISGSQTLTSPVAGPTTNSLTAAVGVVWVNGVATAVTGGQLTIDGNVQSGIAEVGSTSLSDNQRGTIDVSGNFTALFRDTTLQAIFEAQSIVSLVFVLLDTKTATSSFVAFNMAAIRITSEPPDDNAQITRTYNFTAQLNSAGGAALSTDQTIISIQDSDA